MDEESSFLEGYLSGDKLTVPYDSHWFDQDFLSTHNISDNDSEAIQHLFDGIDKEPRDFGDKENSSSGPESPRSEVENYKEITDEEIKTLGLQEFNKFLRGLPKEDAKRIRRRRRNLKNRGYAVTCRLRQQKREEEVAKENEALIKLLEESKNELREVLMEKHLLAEKYRRLQVLMATQEDIC